MDSGQLNLKDTIIYPELASPPATPDAGHVITYIKSSDKKLYTKDSTGAETQIGVSGYSGFSGQSGYSGLSGYSGISGYSGATGPAGQGTFGTWTDKSSSYGAQQASDDGFVFAFGQAGDSNAESLAGYTDSNSNPTTLRQYAVGLPSGTASPNIGLTISFAVKKNDYWKVVVSNMTPTVYWITGLAGQSGYSGAIGTSGYSGYSGSAGASSSFGSWASKSFGSNYQAATDGIVVASASYDHSHQNLDGYSDSASTPTTLRAQMNGYASDSCILHISFPVKKNDYYRVDGGTSTAYYFMPVGS